MRLSFTDDAGNEETLTSAPTAEIRDAPERHNGTDAFKFRIAFSEDISISYVDFRDHSLKAKGAR